MTDVVDYSGIAFPSQIRIMRYPGRIRRDLDISQLDIIIDAARTATLH